MSKKEKPSVYETPSPNEGLGCQTAIMLLAFVMFVGFAFASPHASLLQGIFSFLAAIALVVAIIVWSARKYQPTPRTSGDREVIRHAVDLYHQNQNETRRHARDGWYKPDLDNYERMQEKRGRRGRNG